MIANYGSPMDTNVVDELDLQLVQHLRADSRRSNTDIAREMGLSEATVRKRIGRMVRDGVCAFRIYPDPEKFGFPHRLSLDIRVQPGALRRVADLVAALPEVTFVGICVGDYDLRAHALARSNEHVVDVLQRLNAIAGMREVRTSSILQVIKRDYSFPFLSTTTEGEDSPPIQETKNEPT